ncbi:hypothetical protein GII08_06950 [Lactobacillus acidophilus]|nr:hypothetical protein [Lactobacillus acidophilus]MUV45363.1 hypothetical protein [Lactobacillus acidophilus]
MASTGSTDVGHTDVNSLMSTYALCMCLEFLSMNIDKDMKNQTVIYIAVWFFFKKQVLNFRKNYDKVEA